MQRYRAAAKWGLDKMHPCCHGNQVNTPLNWDAYPIEHNVVQRNDICNWRHRCSFPFSTLPPYQQFSTFFTERCKQKKKGEDDNWGVILCMGKGHTSLLFVFPGFNVQSDIVAKLEGNGRWASCSEMPGTGRARSMWALCMYGEGHSKAIKLHTGT